MTTINSSSVQLSSQQSATPTEQGKDPLLDYTNLLTDKYPHHISIPARPIAEPTATTYGADTLAQFTGLKMREAAGQLYANEAEYARYGTPVTRRLESKLAVLEGAQSAAVFSSGMAAITAVIDSILPLNRSAGHLIVFDQGYRQTNKYLERMAARGQIELSKITLADFQDLRSHLRENTIGIFFETPSNPFLNVIDVDSVKQQLKDINHRALVIVDHTFATPINQTPLKQGADLVVPSLTKYHVGDNTALGGVVAGASELLAPIVEARGMHGTINDDAACLKIEHGLYSLHTRVQKANINGMFVANLLAGRSEIVKFWYPGHISHPDHTIARKQMQGFGGVISFLLKANNFQEIAAFSDAFVKECDGIIAPTFGGQKPILSVVSIVSHFQQSLSERSARGIPFNLIRISLGTGSSGQLENAFLAGFSALNNFNVV